MDLIDQAQIVQDLFMQSALQRQATRSTADAMATLSPDCMDCGNPIPAQRLASIGVSRCIECQQALEKQARRYAQ